MNIRNRPLIIRKFCLHLHIIFFFFATTGSHYIHYLFHNHSHHNKNPHCNHCHIEINHRDDIHHFEIKGLKTQNFEEKEKSCPICNFLYLFHKTIIKTPFFPIEKHYFSKVSSHLSYSLVFIKIFLYPLGSRAPPIFI